MPERKSYAQVGLWCSTLFACGAVGSGIYFMDAHIDTKVFIVEAILYMCSSSVTLAMTLRDIFERKVFEAELEGRHIASIKVEMAARNVICSLKEHQRLFQILCFFVAVGAILAIVFGLINWATEEDKDK